MDAILSLFWAFFQAKCSRKTRHEQAAGRPEAFTTQHHAIFGRVKRVFKYTAFRQIRGLNVVIFDSLWCYPRGALHSEKEYPRRTSELEGLQLFVGAHDAVPILG